MNEDFWSGSAKPAAAKREEDLAQREAVRIAEDLQHYRDQDNWPYWPLLPVKRANGHFGDPDFFGVVFGSQPIVYVGASILALKAGRVQDILAGYEQAKYPSWEALAADWMVD